MDAKDKDGTTALIMACNSGHVEAARLLLEKGADRTLPTPSGRTVLEDLNSGMFDLTEEKVAQLRALLA